MRVFLCVESRGASEVITQTKSQTFNFGKCAATKRTHFSKCKLSGKMGGNTLTCTHSMYRFNKIIYMFEFDMFSMSNRSFIACTMYTHTRSRWVINGLLYIRLNTSDNSVWQTRIIWTSNFWYFPVFFYSTMPSWLFLFIVYCRMHGIGCFICLFVCKKKTMHAPLILLFSNKKIGWVSDAASAAAKIRKRKVGRHSSSNFAWILNKLRYFSFAPVVISHFAASQRALDTFHHSEQNFVHKHGGTDIRSQRGYGRTGRKHFSRPCASQSSFIVYTWNSIAFSLPLLFI